MKLHSDTWDSLALFYSTSTTQNYLQNHYEKSSLPESKQKSFQNTPVYIHYLKSAETYYKEANKVAFTIKPVLLFYGYIQLIKACLLSLDPYYPNSTTLLAHGVTTRKRKKQQYEFLEDEVKIQRNGLFPYMSSKMFHVKQFIADKLAMKDLLYCMPELNQQFQYFFHSNCFMLQQQSSRTHITSSNCLNQYHMTANRMQIFLSSNMKRKIECQETKEHLIFKFDEPLTLNYHQPFHFHCEDQQFHIIKKNESPAYFLNEMLLHYLLLYNLSMIARYETEWWMDLASSTSNEDYPFIRRLLHVTMYKTPLLVNAWLFNEREYLYK